MFVLTLIMTPLVLSVALPPSSAVDNHFSHFTGSVPQPWAYRCRNLDIDALARVKNVVAAGVKVQVPDPDETYGEPQVCDPNQWTNLYQLCEDNGFQSPIDIPANLPVKRYPQRKTVNMNQGAFVIAYNNGRNLKVVMDDTYNATRPYVVGGPLPDKTTPYYLSYMNWHVGRDNTKGSAHTFAGKGYPMELTVHYLKDNSSFGDLSVAVSVFFSVDESNATHAAFQELLDGFQKVKKFDQMIDFDVSNFILTVIPAARLATYADDYTTYQGSLLTPPCTGNVLWVLLNNPTPVSSTQIQAMRELTDEYGLNMVDNSRPVQKLAGRQVIKSDPNAIPWP